MSLPRIAVDAMGGDEGVRVMIEGAALARRRHDRFKFLLVGDEEGYGSAVEQAVQYQVGQGKTPDAARRSVLSSISSREPSRRAFGRQITPEESSAIEARMSPVSRQSYQRSRSAFARFRGTGRKRTALGRGRRTRKPRARRRSALVR